MKVGNNDQAVSDIPQGETEEKLEDDQEPTGHKSAKSTTDLGRKTPVTTTGGLSEARKGKKITKKKYLGH